jgi:hypothetical protein
MDLTLYRVELAELIAFSAVLLLAGFAGTGFVRLSLCRSAGWQPPSPE